jgi:hypothetical protein
MKNQKLKKHYKLQTSQIYRDYYIHNFFSIKIEYEKYHLYRNKQSFHKGFTLLHLLHKHTEATICIFFSVSNLHMKNTFYIATSNHFKKRFTCYINIQGDTILYCKSNFLYTEQYISKQCTSQQAFIVKTESSLWTKDKLQWTNHRWASVQ